MASSHSTMPKLYTSTLLLYGWPSITSGAIHCGVPCTPYAPPTSSTADRPPSVPARPRCRPASPIAPRDSFATESGLCLLPPPPPPPPPLLAMGLSMLVSRRTGTPPPPGPGVPLPPAAGAGAALDAGAADTMPVRMMVTPKSATFTVKSRVTSRLCVLRSRWMIWQRGACR